MMVTENIYTLLSLHKREPYLLRAGLRGKTRFWVHKKNYLQSQRILENTHLTRSQTEGYVIALSKERQSMLERVMIPAHPVLLGACTKTAQFPLDRCSLLHELSSP